MSYKSIKILIMKFRNIGDVLLIAPLIENLKIHYPNAQIDVAINEETKEMITLNPYINNIFLYNRTILKSQNLLNKVLTEIKFAMNIRKQQYDLVINTTKGDRGTILALLSAAKIKIGYKSKKILLQNTFTKNLPNSFHYHMVDANLDVLRILNIPIVNKKVKIFFSQDDQEKINLLLQKNNLQEKSFIHIHAVSRWMFKCINDQTMASIIDYCETSLKKKVVLTAAPIEQEMARIKNILNLCKTKPISLAGKLSLKQTSALNQKAFCFIGVDTAIMHLSAANNIPTFAFFGPSSAHHWGPWDNNLMESQYTHLHTGIQHMGMHTIFQENWQCIPCNKDGCNGSKKSDCLSNNNFNQIIPLLRNFLTRNFPNKE